MLDTNIINSLFIDESAADTAPVSEIGLCPQIRTAEWVERNLKNLSAKERRELGREGSKEVRESLAANDSLSVALNAALTLDELPEDVILNLKSKSKNWSAKSLSNKVAGSSMVGGWEILKRIPVDVFKEKYEEWDLMELIRHEGNLLFLAWYFFRNHYPSLPYIEARDKTTEEIVNLFEGSDFEKELFSPDAVRRVSNTATSSDDRGPERTLQSMVQGDELYLFREIVEKARREVSDTYAEEYPFTLPSRFNYFLVANEKDIAEKLKSQNITSLDMVYELQCFHVSVRDRLKMVCDAVKPGKGIILSTNSNSVGDKNLFREFLLELAKLRDENYPGARDVAFRGNLPSIDKEEIIQIAHSTGQLDYLFALKDLAGYLAGQPDTLTMEFFNAPSAAVTRTIAMGGWWFRDTLNLMCSSVKDWIGDVPVSAIEAVLTVPIGYDHDPGAAKAKIFGRYAIRTRARDEIVASKFMDYFEMELSKSGPDSVAAAWISATDRRFRRSIDDSPIQSPVVLALMLGAPAAQGKRLLKAIDNSITSINMDAWRATVIPCAANYLKEENIDPSTLTALVESCGSIAEAMELAGVDF